MSLERLLTCIVLVLLILISPPDQLIRSTS